MHIYAGVQKGAAGPASDPGFSLPMPNPGAGPSSDPSGGGAPSRPLPPAATATALRLPLPNPGAAAAMAAIARSSGGLGLPMPNPGFAGGGLRGDCGGVGPSAQVSLTMCVRREAYCFNSCWSQCLLLVQNAMYNFDYSGLINLGHIA